VAEIAEAVMIGVSVKRRIESHAIRRQQIGTRDGWTLSVRIIGVGCGQS